VETRTVGDDEGELRLDRWFKRHYPKLPYGQLAKLLRTGQVRVDGRRAKPNQRVQPGQSIRVPPLPQSSGDGGGTAQPITEADRAAFAQSILHDDPDVLAINKPHGLASQGGTHVQRSVDALAAAHAGEDAEHPRLVHRLDKDTSGVLLLARTAGAAAKLSDTLKAEGTEKVYWALTAARPPRRHGRIAVPLAKRKRGGGEKMGYAEDGKHALTLYREIAHTRDGIAWLALIPKTGRTHQLRAHLAHVGAPILADGKYGGRDAYPEHILPDKLHLHARRLAVAHPADGTTLRLTAPLPAHMAETFQQLGFDPAAGDDVLPHHQP